LTLFESETYTRFMKDRRISLAALLLAAVVAGTPPAIAQTPQRSMYVSVVNDTGAPVPDLGTSDFLVREDNVAREVLRVAPATEPMQIAVLVDTSQTARNDITHMRQGLPPFVTALTNPNESGKKNEVAIIAFGERPTIFTDYTTDPSALTKGINRIWATPGSGAYFVDAVLEVTQGFKKREAQRPVIVAIVVEGEELSYKRYDQVLEPLRNSGAALYVIMLGSPSSDLSDEGRSRSIVSDQGPATTGGQRDQLLTSMALPDRLKQLANQLTHQYLVTYARPESLIPPEKISVASARPGLIARGTPIKQQDRK
jgi:VWFA-related protein